MKFDFNTLMLMYDYYMSLANEALDSWYEVGDDDYVAMNQYYAVAQSIKREIEVRV